ncbi:transposase [Kamptonema sp. PCC 6506]|nr:transposase [Kamptonema sp. PCC 6506]
MQPYSIDFRQKIIEVREQENISIRKLAERFKVAKSFVQKLLKRAEQTGDISPLTQGGSPPTKLNSEQLVTLVKIIEEHNDATLQELTELLEEKTGIKVSRATMGRISNRLNYSFKKKRSMRLRKPASECKKPELNFGIKSGM